MSLFDKRRKSSAITLPRRNLMHKNLLSLMLIALPIIILTNNNHNEPSQEELKRQFDALEYPHKKAILSDQLPERLRILLLETAKKEQESRERWRVLQLGEEKICNILLVQKRMYLEAKSTENDLIRGYKLDSKWTVGNGSICAGDIFDIESLDEQDFLIKHIATFKNVTIKLNNGNYVTLDRYIASHLKNKDSVFKSKLRQETELK